MDTHIDSFLVVVEKCWKFGSQRHHWEMYVPRNEHETYHRSTLPRSFLGTRPSPVAAAGVHGSVCQSPKRSVLPSRPVVWCEWVAKRKWTRKITSQDGEMGSNRRRCERQTRESEEPQCQKHFKTNNETSQSNRARYWTEDVFDLIVFAYAHGVLLAVAARRQPSGFDAFDRLLVRAHLTRLAQPLMCARESASRGVCRTQMSRHIKR